MPAPSFRQLLLATVGITVVVVAGLSVFVVVSRQAKNHPGDVTQVVVTDSECRPNHLTVPAGIVAFSIRNDGTRAQEWEIIQGVMVIEERENIAPGLSQKMTVRLEPGEYEITCGSQSKFKAELRGKLTVTPSHGGAQPSIAKPKTAELVGALAEYRFFLLEETAALKEDTQAFTDAVKAGQLDRARELYPQAHVHYERIKPIAKLFSDLDGSIDSRAEEHRQKEADPSFIGFHRLEYELFAKNGIEGLESLVDRLREDTASLEERIRSLPITPEKMGRAAATLLEDAAAAKISGQEERYSRTDLWDLKANIEGAEKIVDLLRPMQLKADSALQERIDANLARVNAILGRYVLPDGGYLPYDRLTEDDRNAMKALVEALAGDLSRVRNSLELN